MNKALMSTVLFFKAGRPNSENPMISNVFFPFMGPSNGSSEGGPLAMLGFGSVAAVNTHLPDSFSTTHPVTATMSTLPAGTCAETVKRLEMIAKLVIENLIEKLDLDIEKTYCNLEFKGNTVSSTIPIALEDASRQKKIRKNDLLLLSGFGVGLSWGSCIIKWDELI